MRNIARGDLARPLQTGHLSISRRATAATAAFLLCTCSCARIRAKNSEGGSDAGTDGVAPVAPVAPVAADAEASKPRPAREAFDVVLASSREDVTVFPAGDRALVARGARFVGYAEAGKAFVEDASLSSGLPAGEDDAPQLLAGRFPKLVLVYGHYGGSGGEPTYLTYAWRENRWVREGKRAWERPSSIAMYGEGFVLFDPEPFHFENGMLGIVGGKPKYPCSAKPERPIGAAIRRARPPLVAPSFFPMAIATDGAGEPMAWGYVACAPGAHAGYIDSGDRFVLEALPGTETCAERDPDDNLPLVAARIFPAADGGAFALVSPTKKPCMAEPRRLYRGPRGGWKVDGPPLPMDGASGQDLVNASSIDGAGVAFLVTGRNTVLRVDRTGHTDELAPTKACLAPAPSNEDDGPPGEPRVRAVITPFPGDAWIVVAREREHALCRAVSTSRSP